MKVLCPIDFSKSSVNACFWIADFLSQLEGSELDLCHFIQDYRRASIFDSIDDLFVERAEKDMEDLNGKLKTRYKDLPIHVTIYRGDPKDGIVHVAKSEDYDLIVSGTSGLNAVKMMTIGSVTKYIFDHSSFPVLAVPANATFRKIDNVALAADKHQLTEIAPLFFLRDLIKEMRATLHIIHVHGEVDSGPDFDPAIDNIFGKLDLVYQNLTLQGSLTDTLSNYCKDQNVDLLCMIHHPKGWFKRLFSKSVTTSELFNLTSPLLVLRA